MAEYIDLDTPLEVKVARGSTYKPYTSTLRELLDVNHIPYTAADVRPVVLCRDCVYWQKPQVKLNDGTYRDYEQGEYENGSLFGGVTADVGINIGSFCAKYNTEHQNRIPQFMGENDFCSKGYKLRGES